MKTSLLLFVFVGCVALVPAAQNVGIGTTNPNAAAILEVKSTNKGVLFPRLTTAQRNAITTPVDGLHIFNTDERCLNYYDSAFKAWNCYCPMDTCRVVTIRINNGCAVDFQSMYAVNYPGVKKFVLLIEAGTILQCGLNPSGALNFANVPVTTPITIKIINRGSILGAGGSGGTGSTGHPGGSCYRFATNGGPGGNAINTIPGITIVVDNYGLIAGGGGGGGGGGGVAAGQYGGGGGGGAGTNPGNGGTGGGNTLAGPGSCATITSVAQNGTAGTATTGGPGGTGTTGNGGMGGGRGQVGQPGTGASGGFGGIAGKAISGGTGNIINNISGGQTFGVVD